MLCDCLTLCVPVSATVSYCIQFVAVKHSHSHTHIQPHHCVLRDPNPHRCVTMLTVYTHTINAQSLTTYTASDCLCHSFIVPLCTHRVTVCHCDHFVNDISRAAEQAAAKARLVARDENKPKTQHKASLFMPISGPVSNKSSQCHSACTKRNSVSQSESEDVSVR